jgi:hypothetical protein
LRRKWNYRHPRTVDEEQGIYRGEVTAIMFGIADLKVGVEEILSYLRDEDEDEEEEEEEPEL